MSNSFIQKIKSIFNSTKPVKVDDIVDRISAFIRNDELNYAPNNTRKYYIQIDKIDTYSPTQFKTNSHEDAIKIIEKLSTHGNIIIKRDTLNNDFQYVSLVIV